MENPEMDLEYYNEESGGYKTIVAWLLFMTLGFGVVWLSAGFFKYLFVGILLYFFIRTSDYNIPERKWYVAYLVAVLGSCVYSFVFNGQNPVKVFAYSYNYLGLFSLFIFAYYRFKLDQVEKAIAVISIIWCCCYIFQWLIYPRIIWSGAANEITVNEEFFRMRMPGSICSYCLFLYGINKWLVSKKPFYVGCTALALIPIFIMGFRSLTAATVICAFLLIGVVTKKVGKMVVWAAVFSVLGICALNIPIVSEKMEEMIERNEDDQNFDNEDYVRYFEYDYFANEFFVKPGEKFFGSGASLYDQSKYGRKLMTVEDRLSFFWVDLGLVGLSLIIGIPAVIIFLIILYKGVRNCRDDGLQYIRFTIITVVVASIVTSMEAFRDGNQLIMGLYLYAIMLSARRDKEASDSDGTLNSENLIDDENRNPYLS